MPEAGFFIGGGALSLRYIFMPLALSSWQITNTRAMGVRIIAEREETIPDKPKGRRP